MIQTTENPRTKNEEVTLDFSTHLGAMRQIVANASKREPEAKAKYQVARASIKETARASKPLTGKQVLNKSLWDAMTDEEKAKALKQEGKTSNYWLNLWQRLDLTGLKVK